MPRFAHTKGIIAVREATCHYISWPFLSPPPSALPCLSFLSKNMALGSFYIMENLKEGSPCSRGRRTIRMQNNLLRQWDCSVGKAFLQMQIVDRFRACNCHKVTICKWKPSRLLERKLSDAGETKSDSRSLLKLRLPFLFANYIDMDFHDCHDVEQSVMEILQFHLHLWYLICNASIKYMYWKWSLILYHTKM